MSKVSGDIEYCMYVCMREMAFVLSYLVNFSVIQVMLVVTNQELFECQGLWNTFEWKCHYEKDVKAGSPTSA